MQLFSNKTDKLSIFLKSYLSCEPLDDVLDVPILLLECTQGSTLLLLQLGPLGARLTVSGDLSLGREWGCIKP